MNTRSRETIHSSAGDLPHSGDWRGLAEAYFGIAASEFQEARNESALKNFEQALKLIGRSPGHISVGQDLFEYGRRLLVAETSS